MTDDFKDLGCANGWLKDPPEFAACRHQGHIGQGLVTVHSKGPYWTEYECSACKIRWDSDSSG